MTRRAAVRELLEEHGRTRAGEAGIRMELSAAGLRPAFDERALHTAAELGLPKTPGGLARLVDAEDLPKLAAALVRAGLS
ncbi:hypothetical protein AB0P12_26805 [Streptomyces subrutilus]|uniref:hypothetical protein n=1 Tax=Streptomyces subrutilus TaxID=36818 RepID=UPI0033FB1CDD